MVAAILSPAKAVSFLQKDEQANAGTTTLLETAGALRQMLGKDTCAVRVIEAFNTLSEGQFVRFIDLNKAAAQRGKLSGANILEAMVAVCNRAKLTDEAKAFLSENTPPTNDDATA